MKKVVKRPFPYYGTAFHHLFLCPAVCTFRTMGAKSGGRMKHRQGKDNKPIYKLRK